MQHKHFKITEESTLNDIESCLNSVQVRNEAIVELCNKLGSTEALQYQRGGIAAFKFNEAPCKKSWKKVKHGYLPKAKSDELKLMSDLPEVTSFNDVIKKYGLGDEMIIGEPKAGGMGFPMHSSYIRGNRKTNFYAVSVPYKGDFNIDIHPSLLEIKEWEVIKALDEGK